MSAHRSPRIALAERKPLAPTVAAQPPAPALAFAPALALALALGAACARVDPESPPPTAVVLIVIDTLRADALGAYGAGEASTPVMDELAEGGLLFERCLAPSSWTWPSTASLMTARNPPEHGLIGRNGSVLSPDLPTLAEAFGAAGWATAAFVANPIIEPGIGLERGFDVWSGADATWEAAVEPIARAAEWLKTLPEDAPYFLYIHIVEPHSPYKPSEESARVFDLGPELEVTGKLTVAYHHMMDNKPYDEELITTFTDWRRTVYAAETRDADVAVGEILDLLRGAGRLDRTLVAITSDHGEEFLEHGLMGHGGQLYPESVHVPLIMSGPRVPVAERVAERVENRLLGPTLLRLAGIPGGGLPRADLTDSEERRLRLDEPALLHLGKGVWRDEDGGFERSIEQEGLVLDGVVSVRATLESGVRTGGHGAFGDAVEPELSLEVRIQRLADEFAELERPSTSAPLSEDLAARLRGLGYSFGEDD